MHKMNDARVEIEVIKRDATVCKWQWVKPCQRSFTVVTASLEAGEARPDRRMPLWEVAASVQRWTREPMGTPVGRDASPAWIH